MPRVTVVLVRPETPANVGAVARVIRNLGLHALALVAPGDWRTVECWRTAWRAQDVLEQAREYSGLDEALGPAEHVIAFSGRRSRGVPVLDVREAAEELARLRPDAEAALVFGPETSGLAEAELAGCGRRAFIPTDRRRPSLNLSHAVAVAAYEVRRAGLHGGDRPRLASQAEKQAMLGLLARGLRAVGALPPKRVESAFREWEALFRRADLTPKEVKLLEHLSRKLLARAPGEGE